MIPKPSVALWIAKPMIRTVASPISPLLAETPIARPSAKLWSPIAAAIVIPTRIAWALAVSEPLIEVACSAVIASVAPPAIGGGFSLGRIQRSTSARPAQPAVKPTPSSSERPITSPQLPPSPSPSSSTGCSTSSTPWTRISPKRKARTPTENIASATRERVLSS